ncbi:selenocysteine-specific translation elongation factor [Bacillus sp. SM2101]|uniref:selenocysteine-specific translation elongation factor n=1 Tax=Bacillus sp. SM2101 TaxID=2805366 RepID=UPI001BDF269E|nr:selenocysteine-specific translation elongation factor [Bacillus sp. SM2101]
MTEQHYTIGLAGHIDHGKTALTKALTNVDTDRLKEEKERKITIELGFAPLHLHENMLASIIDCPGHERFIRQMISGVAGIDVVVIVIAADEGVMPQTKEHLEILSFLGIKHGVIAISKIDTVDDEMLELVKEDIQSELQGTVFEYAPALLVDSLSNKGIDELKEVLLKLLRTISPRNTRHAFRLPIDQVFTLKGQGTVVRGTVFDGSVREDEQVTILPSNQRVNIRQMQMHSKPVDEAWAGQRIAINVSSLRDEVKRGDVLVSSSESYLVTNTIDIALSLSKHVKHTLKQRSLVKCHIGTAEIMAKIVFFDRNEVNSDEDHAEILCQLRLAESTVVTRGDRFIIRRPTPVETIGGGWVIDPNGQKYRFGKDTVSMLHSKMKGTPKERLLDMIEQAGIISIPDINKRSSIDERLVGELVLHPEFVVIKKNQVTLNAIILNIIEEMKSYLHTYHVRYPLRTGINKAELLQHFSTKYPTQVLDFVLNQTSDQDIFIKKEQFISMRCFTPSYPKQWSKRMENMIQTIRKDGITVLSWAEYVKQSGLPDREAEELRNYLISTGKLVRMSDKYYIHFIALQEAITKLRSHFPKQFELKDAKDVLQLSRKYLVPLLELIDKLKYTMREDSNRVWVQIRSSGSE